MSSKQGKGGASRARHDGSDVPVTRQAVKLAAEKVRLLDLKDIIFQDLQDKLEKGDPLVVKALSSLYPVSFYKPSEHCVYCHESFDPKLKEKCTIPHEVGELDIEAEGCGEFAVSTECLVCGETFEGYSLREHEVYDCVTGACYEGPYHCSKMEDRKAREWFGDMAHDDIWRCEKCQVMYTSDEEED